MAAYRVYQDFEPFFEWAEDEGSATLVVMLPGFIKEQLRIQVTSTGVLRVNGERQVFENIWRRFGKEFSIPSYCDSNEVSAKFERGMLSVKFPKLITPAKPDEQEAITNPPEEAPMPQAPSQVVDQQESPKKEQVISDENEKNKKTDELAPENVDQNKKVSTNEVSKTAQVETPKAQEKQQQQPKKMTQRLKTRLLDFSISLRGDQDVNKGFGNNNRQVKRRKILMNMIVTILLVMVLGVYIKNAFRSSSLGESKFQEF